MEESRFKPKNLLKSGPEEPTLPLSYLTQIDVVKMQSMLSYRGLFISEVTQIFTCIMGRGVSSVDRAPASTVRSPGFKPPAWYGL